MQRCAIVGLGSSSCWIHRRLHLRISKNNSSAANAGCAPGGQRCAGFERPQRPESNSSSSSPFRKHQPRAGVRLDHKDYSRCGTCPASRAAERPRSNRGLRGNSHWVTTHGCLGPGGGRCAHWVFRRSRISGWVSSNENVLSNRLYKGRSGA